MALMAFSFSLMIRVVKFGVGGSGMVESGCCISAKGLKTSAIVDWK